MRMQTIREAATAIQAGTIQPIELVEDCLAQIRAYEDRIHAWVLVDADGARRAAEELGQAASRGQWRGPLHGIPLGIKDIVDVAGFPTRAGSPLCGNHLAEADAPVVTALRRAGAIILGKTVTVEFACFDPSPTRNPWEPISHTPGGSSSGSAAAVATGMCLGAIGTQTGGSLVRPAAFCGVAACKPTFGTISTAGIVPVSYHLDHPGPMARTVADLEILLRSMGGRVQGETAPVELPPRLGLVEAFFMDEADATMRSAIETAVARLAQAGARIERVGLPFDFAEFRWMHRTIMAAEAAATHREQFAAHRESYGPLITGLLDEGLSLPAVDYAAVLARQRELRERIAPAFDGFDALIAPSTETTAPADRTTTGTPKFQAPWSCLGTPVVSIPCGLAEDGMPAGLQLVRRHYEEAALLEVAGWCERELAMDRLPAILGEGRG